MYWIIKTPYNKTFTKSIIKNGSKEKNQLRVEKLKTFNPNNTTPTVNNRYLAKRILEILIMMFS
jgi:hypothetical protein